MQRPTFDQIIYMPDLGERLTLTQAEAFRRRFHDALMRLGSRVVEELHQRNIDVTNPTSPIDVFTPRELVQYCQPRRSGRGITAGQVYFRMSSGSHMPIALMVLWDDENLTVFWGQLKPDPSWRKLSERRARDGGPDDQPREAALKRTP